MSSSSLRKLAAPLVEDSPSTPTTGKNQEAKSEGEALLPEREMLREEALSFARRRAALGLGSSATDGIGVCFSGGGVRAASFDCGILWKLAELKLLKDVDVLSAVSGGGYAASSYASHVVSGDEAPHETDVDDWYQLAACKQILKMQDNIGYLVTTSHSLFWSPGKKRAGTLFGRIFDIPAFAAIIIGMPVANVATFIIFWAMPLASLVNLNHGRSMRAYLCSRTSNYYWFPSVAIFVSVVSFVCYLVLRLIDHKFPDLVAKDASRGHRVWLFHKSTKVLTSRASLIALTYGILVIAAMGMEKYDYGRAYYKRDVKCACARYYGWDVYQWSDFADYRRTCDDAEKTPLANDRSFTLRFLFSMGVAFLGAGLVAILGAPSLLGLVARFVGPLVGILAVAYVAEWRVFGPVTRQRFIWGAMAYNAKFWTVLFFTSCALAIAHLPSQHELPRTLHRFYARSLRRAFFVDGLDHPLGALRDDFDLDKNGVVQQQPQEDRRPSSQSSEEEEEESESQSQSQSQSGGFGGETKSLGKKNPSGGGAQTELLPSPRKLTAEGATPLLVLGATINEFRRPETEEKRGHTFALTPRGWGGTHTGYAKPPRWLTLSRAMAISGAAIDGFVLNEFDSKALRLALQVTNLTMGDTIRFSGVYADDDEDSVAVSPALAAVVEAVEAPLGLLCGRRDDELVPRYRLTNRERRVARWLPDSVSTLGSGIRVGDPLSADELASTLHGRTWEMAIFAVVYGLFCVSAAFYDKSADKQSIYTTPSPVFAAAAVCLMGAAAVASVYAYFPNVRFLLAAPIVQQVHLLLLITHFGTRAPPFATLTDGGLTECIGLVELLRRRLRWIVVVDTTEDPALNLRYLKQSLDMAKKENLVVGDFTDGGSRAKKKKKEGPLPPHRLDFLLSKNIRDFDYVRLRATYPGSSNDNNNNKGGASNFPLVEDDDDVPTASETDIFVIKMQEPETTPRCLPYITPAELLAHSDVDPATLDDVPLLPLDAKPLDLQQDELNGLCCECCHATCSCLPCGKLPFLSVGNQFLTPFQFSNLCRLAHELADAPLRALRDAKNDANLV